MALDVYSWLAQRLHRVHPLQPQFIPWAAVKAQFGFGYGRMDNFKRRFRFSQAVLSQYRAARVELDDHGMTLRYSRPPVKGRMRLQPRLGSPRSAPDGYCRSRLNTRD